MALTDVGVSFKAENFNKFLAAIGKAAEATALLSNVSGNTAYKLDQLYQKLDKSTRLAQSYFNVINEGSKAFGKGIDNMVGKLEKSDNLFKRVSGNMARTVIDAGKIGAAIGGAFAGIVGLVPSLAAALPTAGLGAVVTEAIFAAGGAILGAAAGVQVALIKGFIELGVGIVEAIGGFFGKIGAAVAKFVGKAVEAIYKAGLSIAKALVDIIKNIYNKLKSVVDSIIGLIKKVFNSLFGMFSGEGAIAGRGGWRGLGSSIFSAMFKFEVLKQVIRSVINEVKQFSQAAFQAAVDLQTLTVRLDNLIARQIRAAKLTDDYAVSVRMAGKYTQGLLQWSQKLALASPISLEDVTNTVSLSIAMGWTVESAKELTKSIIDYTTATGLGSEISERIIYNFAQMKQQGKVTGTELRDLGRGAFMPVNDILKIMYEDMGDVNMSFEEFKQQASEGKVAVEGFFAAFNEYVAKNMPDAAYKMNYTFAAVMNNMRDLFNVLLGWNVLGPMIAALTKPFQNLIDTLSRPSVLANLNAFGKAMAFLFESVRGAFGEVFGQIKRAFGAMGLGVPTIENVVKSIIKLGLFIQWVGQQIGQFVYHIIRPFAKEVGEKIGGTFDGLNEDAFGWGFGLISNFVQGMLRAVTTLLVKVITFISNLLRSWFKISSPPKILPKIDKWGAGTINEWIDGMVEGADYDKISEVGGKVAEALVKAIPDQVITVPPIPPAPSPVVNPNSMAPAINPNQTNAAGTITYTPVLTSPDPTTMSKDLSSKVNDAVTMAIPSISQEGLRVASVFMHGFSQADFDILDEIQGSLNDVLSALVNLGSITADQSAQMYIDISQNLIRGLDEFNRTGKISVDIFGALNNIGGVFGQEIKELVQLEIQYALAVEKVASAQKAYDDAVKASIAAEKKVNTLIRAYNSALRKGASKQFLKDNLKLVNAAEIQWGINKKNESVREQELDLAKEQQKIMEEQVKLQRSLMENLVELTKKQGDAAGSLGESMDELGDDIDGLLAGLGDPETWKGLDFDQLFKDAKAEFNTQLNGIKADWGEFITENFGKESPISKALGGIWNTLTEVWRNNIAPTLKGLWDDFASYLHLPTWDEIMGAWENPPNYKPPPQGVAFTGQFNTDVANVEQPTLVNRFQAVLEKFREGLKGQGIVDILKGIGQWILDTVIDGIKAANAPGGLFNDILDKIFGSQEAGPPQASRGLQNEGQQKASSRIFTIIWQGIQDGWRTYSPQILGFMKGVGYAIMNEIWTGVKNFANDFFQTKIVQPVMDKLKNAVMSALGFQSAGEPTGDETELEIPLWAKIGEGIVNAMYTAFSAAISTKWKTISTALDTFIQNIKDKLGYGKESSLDNPFNLIGQAIGQAIINGMNYMKTNISTAVNGIVAMIFSLLPAWLQNWIIKTYGSPIPGEESEDLNGDRATGGSVQARKVYKVGEKGPEIFVPDVNGYILPNDIYRAFANLARVPAVVSATPVINNTNITFGDTYIQNDMDWAIFKARVQRAMTGS